jgi:hypothetical protein
VVTIPGSTTFGYGVGWRDPQSNTPITNRRGQPILLDSNPN